jgi:hypothetical protein
MKIQIEGNMYFIPNKIEFVGKKHSEIKLIFKNNHKQLNSHIVSSANQIAHGYFNSRNASLKNEPLLRLDDIQNNHLYFSVTSNVDKVITNWSADFKFKEAFSIRDWYEPGPFLSPLKESQMSNGIGFNLMIKTVDDKYIITKRNKKTLVSNNNYASSLMGRIQLNHFRIRHKVTIDDINENFKENLFTFFAEYVIGYYLPLSTNVEDVRNAIEFLGIGRDLITAGTPQFYLYLDLKNVNLLSEIADSKYIQHHYDTNIANATENSEYLINLYNLQNKKFNKKNPLYFKSINDLRFSLRNSKKTFPDVVLEMKMKNKFKKVRFTPSEMVVWSYVQEKNNLK